MNKPDDHRALEIHIVCTVRSKPEHRERVKQLLLELVEPARNEDGCLYYDLYQDANAPATFILLDGWISKEALAMHVVHPNVPRVVDQMLPLLSHPIANIYTTRVSESKGGQNESLLR
jgi:quinol monooxygenase YgiN